jgi:hypothetical protein
MRTVWSWGRNQLSLGVWPAMVRPGRVKLPETGRSYSLRCRHDKLACLHLDGDSWSIYQKVLCAIWILIRAGLLPSLTEIPNRMSHFVF